VTGVQTCALPIQAQRLVRKICPHCKEDAKLPANLVEEYKAFIPDHATFKIGAGCRECSGTGYQGREMICEVLPISEELSSMIAKEASKVDLFEPADKEGFQNMFKNGMLKAAEGITTVDEILRVAKQ